MIEFDIDGKEYNIKEYLSVGDYQKIFKVKDLFEDDYFKFELDDIKYEEDGIEYIGTLYVPDLEKPHKTIEGNLKGKIVLYNNGSYSLDFFKIIYERGKEVEYDVFEFCGGLEYELDNFIDYIIQELE
jgi:hypothetical protein